MSTWLQKYSIVAALTMTRDWLVFCSIYELWRLYILVQWHCVMQSSDGKNRIELNRIEFDTKLNQIESF